MGPSFSGMGCMGWWHQSYPIFYIYKAPRYVIAPMLFWPTWTGTRRKPSTYHMLTRWPFERGSLQVSSWAKSSPPFTMNLSSSYSTDCTISTMRPLSSLTPTRQRSSVVLSHRRATCQSWSVASALMGQGSPCCFLCAKIICLRSGVWSACLFLPRDNLKTWMYNTTAMFWDHPLVFLLI